MTQPGESDGVGEASPRAVGNATPCPECGHAIVSRLGYCMGCGAYRAEYDQEMELARGSSDDA